MAIRIFVTSVCLLLVALAVPTGEAGGTCAYSGPYRHFLQIRITACETVREYSDRTTAEVQFHWVREMAKRATARPQGVVLTGTLLEKTALVDSTDGGLVVESRNRVSEVGTWYFETAETECSSLPTDLELVVYSHADCCDVTPTYRIGCFFEIPTVQRVPEHLAGLLEQQ